VAGVVLEASRHADELAGLAARRARRHLVQDDRAHAAAPVGQHEAQARLAVAAAPGLAFAHEHHQVDVLTVGELAQRHGEDPRSGTGREVHASGSRRAAAS
jgi:hypothetical protein